MTHKIRVYDALCKGASDPMEIADESGLRLRAVTPCLLYLKKIGLAEKTGQTRAKARKGRRVNVWRPIT